MARSTILFVLVAVSTFLSGTTTSAQSPVLAELYGRGVHAYFCNDLLEAHRYLSMAIDNGSRDPRAHYFRGIVNASTGRQHEAEADWQTGARLEALGEYDLGIGRALQRVQGSMRMQMENIRQMVRLELRATQDARSKARYNDLKSAESEVLRGGAASPAPNAPPAAIPPAAEVDGANNPFGADAAGPGEAVPDAKNDPFQDDPAAPMTPDAGGDAFGTEAPAAEPAGAADPFAPAADPFGAPADDAGTSTPPADAPMTEDPFGADPFGA